MKEHGYGSPDTIGGIDPEVGEYDLGYGSPDTYAGSGTLDTGYGSPFLVFAAESATIEVATQQINDDGGAIVDILADWPTKGPYRVRLLDPNLLPYPSVGFCYSGVPGQGSSLWLRVGGYDNLRFVAPPAPPGVYALEVNYGAGFLQQTIISAAISIITRNRSDEVYAMRRRLPDPYLTGPATSRADSLVWP